MNLYLTTNGTTIHLDGSQRIKIGGSDYDIVLAEARSNEQWASLVYIEGWRLRALDGAKLSVDGVRWENQLSIVLNSVPITVYLQRDGIQASMELCSKEPSSSENSPKQAQNHSTTNEYQTPVMVSSVDTPLGQWQSIGRAPNSAIHLDDLRVDNLHAEFRRKANGLIDIRDKGSTLGTFVNGQPILRAQIATGQAVVIGATTLVNRGGILEQVAALQTSSIQGQHTNNVLEIQNLNARYKGKRGKAGNGLNDINIALPEESFMAVIGPSGAGKSTLFSALVGDIKDVTGDIILKGQTMPQGLPFTQVSVVPQADQMLSDMSVQQILEMVADLRMASDVTKAERKERVDKVLEELGLEKFRHQDAMTQLSGGQRKRVSIGMEILNQTDVLLLDEPTSGLDEGMDRKLMKLLSQRARMGTAVISVTHSMTNLDQADLVCAISRGGKTGYVGEPQQLKKAFEADSYADVMDELDVGKISRQQSQPKIAPNHTQETLAARKTRRLALGTIIKREAVRALKIKPSITGSYTNNILPVIGRLIPFLILVPALFAYFAHAVGNGLAPDGQFPHEKAGTVISVLVITTSFYATSQTNGQLVKDFEYLRREHRWRISALGVVLGKFIVYGLMTGLQGLAVALFFLTFSSGPQGIDGESGNGILIITLVILSITSAAVGLAISSFFKRIDRAMVGLIGILIPQVLLSGLLTHIADLPQPFDWFSRLLPIRWAVAPIAAATDLNSLPLGKGDDLWKPDWDHVIWAWSAEFIILVASIALASFVLSRVLNRKS